MYISGIGMVSAFGRGIDNCAKILREAIIPEAYHVNQDIISAGKLPRRMRRADKFSKMATLAAMDAVEDSKFDVKKKPGSLGIVLSTAFGPHVTTFKFLDDLVTYGEENVSPITFSHSVHNAAVSYITSAIENQGPAITIAGFVFAFHQALLVARSWLDEKRCENVLVGCVDERGEVSDAIISDKMGRERGFNIKPFDFSANASMSPSEGAVFFMVTDDVSKKNYCKVDRVLHGAFAEDKKESGMYILDTDGLSGDETPYIGMKEKKAMVSGYSPLFGSTPGLSAFHCAVAALTIKNQRVYASPVQDNPHGLNLCSLGKNMDIDSVACIKYNCLRERGYIRLERSKKER